MTSQKILKLISDLNADLHALQDAWKILQKKNGMLKDSKFLENIASQIKNLDNHAMLALKSSTLKEQAEVIHYALSTLSGAPFIGETTLLDAANNYKVDNPESALMHLFSGFLKYKSHKEIPLFNVLDEISEELKTHLKRKE